MDVVTGIDWTALAYWVVVPFAFYAVSMDRWRRWKIPPGAFVALAALDALIATVWDNPPTLLRAGFVLVGAILIIAEIAILSRARQASDERFETTMARHDRVIESLESGRAETAQSFKGTSQVLAGAANVLGSLQGRMERGALQDLRRRAYDMARELRELTIDYNRKRGEFNAARDQITVHKDPFAANMNLSQLSVDMVSAKVVAMGTYRWTYVTQLYILFKEFAAEGIDVSQGLTIIEGHPDRVEELWVIQHVLDEAIGQLPL